MSDPQKRRSIFRALTVAATVVFSAGALTKVAKFANADRAFPRLTRTDLAEREALKRKHAGEAHRALDEVLSEKGIASASMADEKALLEAANAGIVLPHGSRQQTVLLFPALSAQFAQTTQVFAEPEVEGSLARMQSDLQRALAKPLEQRRWGMVIDLRKCVGCSACTVACKAENKLPPGVVYRPVIVNEVGTFPNVSMQFTPRPCMQCENPPCVPVCPVGATYKRPDGIVAIDYDVCIGCRYCLTACPYQARTFDWGLYYTSATPELESYESASSFEYGEEWPREATSSPIDNARKCHFCIHRIEVGMLPACVTTCIGSATYFGDLNDPKSLVSEFVGRPNVTRLKEELGTEPKVYYLT